MASLLVTFLLFFLPFVVLPFGTSYFETPKILIAELFILLLCVCTPWFLIVRKNGDRVILALLGGIALLSGTSLLLHPTTLTLLGNVFRHQGVMLLLMVQLFALVSSRNKLPVVSQWGVLFIALLQLFASVFVTGTPDGRLVGTLGEPNALAAFAIFLWAYGASILDKRPLSLFCFFLTTICVILMISGSGSRSGMIGFFIELSFFFIYYIFRLSLGLTSIICLVFFVMSLSLPFFQQDVMYENRAEIWQAALLAGYEKPVIGWGYGNTEIALKAYNQKLYNRLRGYYVDSSHNVFLDWWIQGGFLGLSCLIGLLYSAFRVFITTNRIRETVLLLGILVSLSFNPVSVVTLISFWWVMGQSILEAKKK